MYTYPTAAATPFCNPESFFGYPTKTYASIFNKETPATPFTAPVSPFAAPFERVPTYFPSTFERTYPTTFPWSRTFGAYPWAETTFPSTWTGFPSTTYPSTWGSYPSTWTGFPSTWTGFPSTTFPSTWGSYPSTWTGFSGYNKWAAPRSATCPINNSSLCSTTFRPSSEVEWFTLTNPIRCFEDGTRGLWLCFDLRGYKPEEVTVSINKAERCVIVEAAHEVKEKEHGVSRKFYRKWALPEYMSKIDITKIEFKSFFGPDGLFYVEGVLPRTEECLSWPAYPWTYSCWTNPTWTSVANKWNNTWWNNEWCNTSFPSTWTGIKPTTCKFI